MEILEQLLLGTTLIVFFTLFHVVALVYISQFIRRYTNRISVDITDMMIGKVLSMLVLAIIILHTIEAWGWALFYLFIGEFSSLADALYFSVTTVTTLGYGDLTLSKQWQLLGTFEAMQGLLLFSVTTAFVIDVLRTLFADQEKANPESTE